MNHHPHLRFLSCVLVAWASSQAGAETSGQALALGAGRPLVGTPAPRLVLKTIDGEMIDLGQLYGRQAVYLKFWATWCTPCREQMPHFEHTYESAGADLAVIAIDVGFNDSVDDVRIYRQKLGITMPIVFDDGQIGAAFNLRVTPQHIVIGRDGRIQYVGHLADSRLDAALMAARSAPLAVTPQGGEPATAPAYVPLKVGDPLPHQSLLTVEGSRFRLGDPRDSRHTVLVFLSPWCESYLATTRPAVSKNCRRMREEVSAVAREHSARWLGIASGLWATSDDVREYKSKYSVHIPISLDESGALFRAFGVNQVPAAVVADGSGKILRRIEPRDLKSVDLLRTAINEP